MSDDRLDILKNAVAEPAIEYAQIRINKIKLSNYKFFHGDFKLDFKGKNVLLYGENGSGKSSIYKALGYLSKLKFDPIEKDKNIFVEAGEPSIEIDFSNGRELIIDSDLKELPEAFAFLKGLSVFRPMLDYKKLLPIHYIPGGNGDKINVYELLRDIFKDFSIGDGVVLSSIKEPPVYFEALKKIVNEVLLEEANTCLGFFDADFVITRFVFTQEFGSDSSVKPVINIEIEFKDILLDSYHTFLNEARLSALAISLYFAAIRKLLGTLKSDCLKVLILDDLLISLDMSNRLKLLEILKSVFTDFQIFFFTHDKSLFNIYKSKMDWESFELYLDDTDPIHKPIIKKGSTPLEKAKGYYATKDLDACCNMIRKELERVMESYLTPREQLDRNFEQLKLGSMLDKAISKSNGEIQNIFKNANTYLANVLNPQSHYDDRAIFSQEIKAVIADLEKLKILLK
jgi:energy-coupling factor transporter ATP-binding protein EcfA2